MMQAWADYLDRLKTGEEIEATHGTGLSEIPTSPGIPEHQLTARRSR